MSATLTWYNSGLGTKTGTTAAAFVADLISLINATSPGANFSWQLASSNTGTNPQTIVLKPKSGGVGRILIMVWTSPGGTFNVALFDTTPQTGAMIAFFPNGNVDSPSNITAASGTIMGDDTGVIKASGCDAVASSYSTSVQLFYFDSAEAVCFAWANPAASSVNHHALFAGYILVDNADNAYAACFGSNPLAAGGIGDWTNQSPTNAQVPMWNTTACPAGGNTQLSPIRTNYGSANRLYWNAWRPSGNWTQQAIGPTDILSDTSTSQVWFLAIPLMGMTKGEGVVLKLRQIGIGPVTSGAFTAYNSTGPVVQARQFTACSSGSTAGTLWFTNFKL